MKYQIIILLFLFFSNLLIAQNKVFDINGEKKTLTYEINSKLSLLVDDSNRNYIMYVEKDGQIKELSEKNYKIVLNNFTKSEKIKVENVDFTLRDIRNFVLDYNAKFDDEFAKTPPVSTRLAFLGGVSNYNSYLPKAGDDKYRLAGLSFEFYNEEELNRHSLLLQVRKNLGRGNIDLNIWEIGTGYRFKIINSDKFHLYIETEFFNLHRVKFSESIFLDQQEVTINQDSEWEVELPLGIGGGIAYQIADNFFLTANYNNIAFLGIDDNGESPLDIRFGVKFTL